MLAHYFPRVWRHMTASIRAVLEHDASLRRPFLNSSYPAFGVNFGPRTVCFDHCDSSNSPGVPCAVTALGDYDPRRGGHLVVFDLKLVIEFPPGTTILLPSGSLRHGNTRIAPHETRTSFTQYCPGGLLRFSTYGMKNWRDLNDEERACRARQAADGWAETLGRFSRIESLHADRMQLLSVA